MPKALFFNHLRVFDAKTLLADWGDSIGMLKRPLPV
jgi:hypothetical protein